jgi:hypothetical protein
MDIEYALLADFAELVGGKLYLMGGGWDTSHAVEVPAPVRLAVAVGVRVGWEETNRNIPVRMVVEDEDGSELVRIEGAVNVGRPAQLPLGSTQLAQMAANVGVTLPRFGGYRVRVAVGEDEGKECSLPFRLTERRPGG